MPLRDENWDNELPTKKPINVQWIKKQQTQLRKKCKRKNKRWCQEASLWYLMVNIQEHSTGHYLRFKDYINDITSFEPYLSELKTYIFRFKDLYASKARTRLSQYGYRKNQTTFVSVHVRLTDYHTVLDGLSPISEEYFTRSMEHLASKYHVSHTKHHQTNNYNK